MLLFFFWVHQVRQSERRSFESCGRPPLSPSTFIYVFNSRSFFSKNVTQATAPTIKQNNPSEETAWRRRWARHRETRALNQRRKGQALNHRIKDLRSQGETLHWKHPRLIFRPPCLPTHTLKHTHTLYFRKCFTQALINKAVAFSFFISFFLFANIQILIFLTQGFFDRAFETVKVLKERLTEEQRRTHVSCLESCKLCICQKDNNSVAHGYTLHSCCDEARRPEGPMRGERNGCTLTNTSEISEEAAVATDLLTGCRFAHDWTSISCRFSVASTPNEFVTVASS